VSIAKDTGQHGAPAAGSAGDVPVSAPEPSPVRSGARTLVVVMAAWLVVGVLALLALGRLVHLDDAVRWPYSAVNALTPVVYLPVYATLAVGFAFRRNLLLLVSVPLMVLHLFWTVPEVLPGHAETPPAGAVKLRVLSSNLLYWNQNADRLGSQLRAEHPDVVVLVEASPLTLGRVEASDALRDYPFREVEPREGAFGAAVYSRFPLSAATAPEVAGVPMLRVTVTVDGSRRFVLYAVHTISPTTGDYTQRWRRQLDYLTAEVHRSRLPVLMAGDFNATRDHRPLRRLVDSGVRDAHDVAGAGWAPSWSARSLVPPLLRIDHVLASPAFSVTGYRTGGSIGSDHLPVIADLAMRAG
jgi:endonuclease/exonuclease/phosphatase (EEP) superfamily protein YafD